MTDRVTIEDIDGIPPENTIVVPSRAEERQLRDGLRARGFPDKAIDEYVTVDEARRIIRNAAPECAQDDPIIIPPKVEGESFCWFDHLPDEHKDAALDHGLKYIAARNSKLLDPQNSDNLIPEIARSGAPHAANIFVRHMQKGNGADRQDAIRNCIARRPKAPIGRLIVAAYKYGANFEPWWRLDLDASASDPASAASDSEPANEARSPQNPTPEGARSTSATSEDNISFLPPDIIPPNAPREPEAKAEPPATEAGAHLHPTQEPAPEPKPEPQPQQELPPTVGEKSTTRDQQQQGVPFMLTHAQKAALRARGVSDDEILHISPTQAHEILKKPNGSRAPNIASDIDTRTVTVTFFPNKLAQSQRCIDLTLPQLAEQIRLKTGPSKLTLPWLKLAIFGDQRSNKNCLRTNVNTKEITGIEVEHDKGEITFDTAIAALRTASLRALLYTSPSYVPAAKERWRILLPLSGKAPPDMRATLVARVNGLFGGKLSGESFVLSQAYLYGSVNGNPAHRVEVIDGDFIDLRADLDPGAIGKPATGKDAKPSGQRDENRTNSGREPGKQRPRLPAELRNMLHLVGTQPVGDYPSRSHLLWAFIHTARRRGVDENEIVDACLDEAYRGCAIYEHVQYNGGEDYIKRQIERAINSDLLIDEQQRTIIRVEDGKLDELWRAVQHELINRNCPVYVRGNRLVQPLWRWEKF